MRYLYVCTGIANIWTMTNIDFMLIAFFGQGGRKVRKEGVFHYLPKSCSWSSVRETVNVFCFITENIETMVKDEERKRIA